MRGSLLEWVMRMGPISQNVSLRVTSVVAKIQVLSSI